MKNKKKIVQPRKSSVNVNTKTVKKKSPVTKKKTAVKTKRSHKQEYGTSKLETYFAHEFLDKLCLNYVYEYEAKEIGRFYDFAIVATMPDVPLLMEEKNGIEAISQGMNNVRPILFIEVDGNFWHPDPNDSQWDKLTPTQKHNMIVDNLKNEWCLKHKIPLLRIWESDIRKNPKLVMSMINEQIEKLNTLDRIKANMHRPHKNNR